MKIVIDTSAIIEYFKGTDKGLRVKYYIEGKNDLVVPAIVIAELSNFYRRTNNSKIWKNKVKRYLEIISVVHPVETWIADRAGEIKVEKRKTHKNFSLQDGIIQATAEMTKAKVLTYDEHLLGKNSISI